MHNTATSWRRMLWLLSNELKIKKGAYSLIILCALGILTYLFFNPSFSFTKVIDQLFSPSQTVMTNGRTIFFNNIGSGQGEFPKFHLDFFPKALIITSTIMTSLAFSEYAEEKESRFYITLPATQNEKWIVKALWYILIFPILFFVIYFLFMQLTYIWGDGMGRNTVRLPLMDPYLWEFILLNFFIQTCIFMCSVFYKKYSVIKLFLASIGIYYFWISFRNILVYTLFHSDHVEKLGSIFNSTWWKSYLLRAGYQASDITENFPLFTSTTGTFSLSILLALLVLYISITKYKEIEA